MKPPPLPSSQKRKQRIAILVLAALVPVGVALFWWVRSATVSAAWPRELANTASVSAVLRTLRVSLVQYRGRTGQFPTSEQGLDALVKGPNPAPPHWVPLLEKVPLDPWGRPYQYVRPNPATPDDPKSYDLFSLGPDGVVSGDDVR